MQGIISREALLVALAALTMGLFALVLASPASAALPKTKTKRIVPGKSIAGVKLGMPMQRAKKTWKDPNGFCPTTSYGSVVYELCRYELRDSGANYNTGSIYFTGRAGKKTVNVGVVAPWDGKRHDFKSPMSRYKTKQGVKIGTRLRKLKRVFRKKLKRTYHSSTGSIYEVKGKRKRTTEFNLEGNRVYLIEVRGRKAP